MKGNSSCKGEEFHATWIFTRFTDITAIRGNQMEHDMNTFVIHEGSLSKVWWLWCSQHIMAPQKDVSFDLS